MTTDRALELAEAVLHDIRHRGGSSVISYQESIEALNEISLLREETKKGNDDFWGRLVKG